MFRKTYFTFLLTAALLLTGAAAAFAQNSGPVRGKVFMTKDGAKTPVADAKIDAYRVDGSGALTTKTNKKGEFQYAGFLLGQTYHLAVSGAGLQPQVYPKVKAGMEGIEIEVAAGEGNVLTETEVKQLADGAVGAAGQMSPEDKKRQEEFNKEKAAVEASNANIEKKNALAKRIAKEGADAFNAGDFDTAIAKYSEGVTGVPDVAGITGPFLRSKGLALQRKGYALYVAGAKLTDGNARLAKYGEAKAQFEESLKTYDQARLVIKNAPATTDANETKIRQETVRLLLADAMETHRFLPEVMETNRTAEAKLVYEEAMAGEADAAKKTAYQKNLGDVYRVAGQYQEAIDAYNVVLTAQPDNLEVMAMIGLCMVSINQNQEGLNYMDKYAQTVKIVDTDSPQQKAFKQSIIDTVNYLKNEEKLKPQKPPTTPRRRG